VLRRLKKLLDGWHELFDSIKCICEFIRIGNCEFIRRKY
jgi:hypothetical protein